MERMEWTKQHTAPPPWGRLHKDISMQPIVAIDYRFANNNCLPALRKAVHLLFNRFNISDHCTLFFDFHKPTLFGQCASDPNNGTTKYVCPYHPVELNKYHETLSAYFTKHQIKKQLLKVITVLNKYEPGKAPLEELLKVNALEHKRTELIKSAVNNTKM